MRAMVIGCTLLAFVAVAGCGREPTAPTPVVSKPAAGCVMRMRLSPLNVPATEPVWYAYAYFSVCPDSAQMAAAGWYRAP